MVQRLTKLNALPAPQEEVGELSLADVLDIPSIQAMMDTFLGLTGIGMAILDARGKVLVATGWQDICTKFHRVHPETSRHCCESDTELSSGVEPGTFKYYRCKNNLWDIATPIVLGDRHAGNLFLGQFVFTDEEPEREVFREQAKRYGFDEAAYLAALDRLPRWSRERVRQVMTFYAAFARQLSDLSHGNVRLARALAQRDELLARLRDNEERLRLALKATNDVVWDWNIVNDTLRWNETGTAVFGWTDIVETPPTAAWWVERVHPEDRQRVERTFFAAVHDPAADRWRDEYRFRKAAGAYAYVVDRGHILRDADGRAVRMVGAMLDITERKRAEDALQESETRFRFLVDYSYDVIWTLTSDGVLSYVSPSWKTRLGHEPSDTMGKAFHPFVHPDDVAACENYMLRVLAARTALPGPEYRVRHADGSWRWYEAAMTPVYAQDGAFLYFVGVSRDITEQKRAEADLEFQAYLLQNIRDLVVATDLEGRITYVSPSNCAILGRSRDELMGTHISVLGEDPVRGVSQDEIVRRTREDGQWRGEVVNFTADGRAYLLECRTWLIRDANGTPCGMVGISTDITERKRAANALRESEERFRAANDASLDALLLLRSERDEAGQIRDFVFVDLNRRTEETLRLSRDGLIGRRLCEELPINRDAGFFEKYKRVVETGVPLDEEFFLPETHVPAAWYHHQVVKVGDGVFICHRDIGERKRAEAEREKLQAQFLQAQKMESIGRLAGGVAHDFNNLLMGIMNCTELCRDGVEAEHPIRQWLDEITVESQRSANLVRQLLAFARKQVVLPRALDLNEQIGGMLKMLGRLIGERIELTWSPAVALRLVSADPSHIDQVMANLCVNAADAITGNGRIAIATRNVAIDGTGRAGLPGMATGEYVLLTVADSGCGMDADTLSHVFEPFFTTKGVGRGTGLGLATVYGIVKQSNGFIHVDSAPGAGTTFRIYLPAPECPETEAAPPLAAGPPPGGSETILVVDDERSIRVTAAAHLERLGYTVLMADGPETALRLAREHPGVIDLLLSDMVMPGMGGVELRNRLLSDRPSLKTILITGYTAGEFAEPEGKGTDTVRLTKPVPLRELAIAIRSMLSYRRAAAT
jgi:PAS domain S-box-containing protein